MSPTQNALFIRMDRLGDLVLTLPCDQRVSHQYQAHWVISPGLDFVLQQAEPSRQWTSVAKVFSFKNFWSFYRRVRELNPQVSLVYHAPTWVLLALWLARVPVRGGVLSKWPSFLFLNRGLRQKRSQCEMHELDYNYQLTDFVFSLPEARELWTPVSLKADPQQVRSGLPQKYVVVHPGMGGSALNWPTQHYVELITQLCERTEVVITGTAADREFLDPLKLALAEERRVLWLDGQLSGPQLLSVLENASAIVAPSTGVLHLAASLGAASFGIYSPIQVHQAKRWGPRGRQAQSFMPQVDCPSQFNCLGESCRFFPCMERLRPAEVLAAITAH